MLCGGGTGGHVYPALAVASALKKLSEQAALPSATPSAAHGANQQTNPSASSLGASPNSAKPWSASQSTAAPPAKGLSSGGVINANVKPQLRYIGSVDGMEGDLVKRESTIPFVGLPAAAMRGRNPIQMLKNAGVLIKGVLAARSLLRRERPAAILGTGGYVCVPLFVAAALERVPTLLYLPDIVPGWAGRVLARLATRIAVTFDDSKRYLPAHKVVETGYPVRGEVFNQDKAACRALFGLNDQLPVLLVYGGSRGARSINQAVAALLSDLLELAQVVHVCGRNGDEPWLREAQAKLSPEQASRYHLYPYLHADAERSMSAAFGAADFALSRAGASTMAELPAAGIGSILVPLTMVKQEYNAAALADRGAAISIPDEAMLGSGEPTQGRLWRELSAVLSSPARLQTMAQRSASLAQPDAGARLASEWLALARGG
ncbi:glycosyltransferase [Herpetosiphon sp. NSE202]|uniref:UDP-N-acetylglucosamine--N-acetylmuramyl- (pentapeptide) pyrophosphoryl-undecaprenol N-acetylglucosamine transferase n=1 Tax=Herpetosiphon sp. NSE202 TaxID=3351349 RepID=UPI0036375011